MKLRALIIAGSLIANHGSFACTKMTNNFGDGNIYTARTMDLCIDLPYDIAVYPRGMSEQGNSPTGKQLIWNSKYASIMVREIKKPLLADVDGVNEKGLAVNLLYLQGTEYESRDVNKPGVSVFKWAKYALDNYSTVNQVLAGLNNYQITAQSVRLGSNTVSLPMHFSIEDASGDNAVIEFINGKISVFHGKNYNVMTNEPDYASQLANLARVQKSNMYTLENLPGGASPTNRFVRAYFYSKNLPEFSADTLNSVENMFSAISATFVPYYSNYQQSCGLTGGHAVEDVWPTQWATVIDHKRQTLYLVDGKSGNHVSVGLGKFNIASGQPLRTAQPQKIALSNDISGEFKPSNY